MEIIEEQGQLVRKTIMTEDEIRQVIETLEESIKETTDKIDLYKSYLPQEETVEESEAAEEVNAAVNF